jgi:TPR repeat protein
VGAVSTPDRQTVHFCLAPQKVAKELGVDALVTGRVVQRGDDLSVRAELVEASEDKQLGASSTIQQEIANAISVNLRVRLTSEEKTRLAKPSATNPEAYQLYLKGRYLANQGTAEELKKSIEYFQQAIDKDPGYAMALVGLADSYNWLGGG